MVDLSRLTHLAMKVLDDAGKDTSITRPEHILYALVKSDSMIKKMLTALNEYEQVFSISKYVSNAVTTPTFREGSSDPLDEASERVIVKACSIASGNGLHAVTTIDIFMALLEKHRWLDNVVSATAIRCLNNEYKNLDKVNIDDLESDKPIEVTLIKRENMPDGPLHTVDKVNLIKDK